MISLAAIDEGMIKLGFWAIVLVVGALSALLKKKDDPDKTPTSTPTMSTPLPPAEFPRARREPSVQAQRPPTSVADRQLREAAARAARARQEIAVARKNRQALQKGRPAQVSSPPVRRVPQAAPKVARRQEKVLQARQGRQAPAAEVRRQSSEIVRAAENWDRVNTPVAPVKHLKESAAVSASATRASTVTNKELHAWAKPSTLRRQFILTEIFQPPLSMRE